MNIENADIWTETRKNRKIVTIIHGMRNAQASLASLKKRFNCGGTIKNGKVVLQGNWLLRLKRMRDGV